MSRNTWVTAAALAVVIIAVMVALLVETSAGPSFRAEDHASYDECIRNIPPEWAPGSLARDGAEEACFFVHRRNR